MNMSSSEFRAARIALDLTQAELSKITGMAQNRISDVEAGKRHPTKMQSQFMKILTKGTYVRNISIYRGPNKNNTG